jgi:hypothetical protein
MLKLFSGLGQIFLDFCKWSSTHAIPHIGGAGTLVVGIIWSIIFIAAAAGFLYQFIFQLLYTYFQYPTNVDSTVLFL